MFAIRSTRTQQLRAATGARSAAAVPRPLAVPSPFRLRATDDKESIPNPVSQVGAKTNEKPLDTVPSRPINDLVGSTGNPIQEATVFNPLSELINGRAAMLGFVAAIISEVATHQSVFSQIAGRWVNDELVERPSGQGLVLFAFVVALTTLSTLIPRQNNGERPESRAFFPFTAYAEMFNGRAAQIGFLSLIIVEAIKGSALFA